VSGLLLLLFVKLLPYPGNDVPLNVLKAVDVVGWLAIGWWLLVDWWHVRLRVVAPPVAAWAWTYLIAAGSGGIGYLNWGP
jgi:hypothetical protein